MINDAETVWILVAIMKTMLRDCPYDKAYQETWAMHNARKTYAVRYVYDAKLLTS